MRGSHKPGHERGCHGCAGEGTYVFDEQGELVDEPVDELAGGVHRPLPVPATVELHRRPCALSTLNGSWLIELTPTGVLGPVMLSYVRGPMRIQVGSSSLRASGDIYVRRLVLDPIAARAHRPVDVDAIGEVFGAEEAADVTDEAVDEVSEDGAPLLRWYPQLPKNQYSWYFRSAGTTYSSGVLTMSIVRHLWDRTTQDFVSTDTGTLRLTCRRSLLGIFRRPATMSGTATIGGRTYDVKATKTSDLYRGCRIEVDVMRNRVWPASAVTGAGVTTTFRQVYAAAGWDVGVTVDDLDVPEDASLTNAELQTLLATHRGPGAVDEWRLWLLVGSTQSGLFGIMFDDDTVPREGAVGFADATLGNASNIAAAARNRPLDEVPAAFLRTLVHEAGHALNLFHPKHDVHNPPIGTEVMNQTGDVMGFATTTNPYPGNATFAFATHDAVSLVHAPDPQVRPGWKNFGWGHGSLSSGLPAPVDADGLVNADDAEGLSLELRLPQELFVGEYVAAEVVLTNTGDGPREVTTRLNLAEGDLRLLHVLPTGDVEQTRDIVVACGPRPTTVLQPGESLTGRMQVFFTSEGFTFAEPGSHVVRAELAVDPFTSVRSARRQVRVRTPISAAEADLASSTLDRGVGMAFALGDFGRDEQARQRLEHIAEAHHDEQTGAAGALVLANSLARAHVDYRNAESRDASPDEAQRFLDLAAQGRSATELVALAATVASPVEREAPVVQDALARAKRARKPKEDVATATAIAEDFVEPSAR